MTPSRSRLRRAGVLRVDSISELFDLSELLAKQPRPLGPRLAISDKGYYNAVSRLAKRGRIVQHNGRLFSPNHAEAFDRTRIDERHHVSAT